MLSEGRLSSSVLSNGTPLAHCRARRYAASMLENLILGMVVSIVVPCAVCVVSAAPAAILWAPITLTQAQ